MTASQANNADSRRWPVLIPCVVAMLAIANLQYAWTLFTTDLTKSMHARLDAVQWTLTFFIIAQTTLFPINAYLVDRLGPRLIVTLASLLVAVGWIGAGSGQLVTSSLCGLCHRRHWRRRSLWRLRWRRDEVVSRSARPLCGRGRRLVRIRHGAHRAADRLPDRAQRISHRVHRLRRDSGSGGVGGRAVPAHASRRAGCPPAGRRSKRKCNAKCSSHPAITRPAKCCAADRFICFT